jgi:hypothetical protein
MQPFITYIHFHLIFMGFFIKIYLNLFVKIMLLFLFVFHHFGLIRILGVGFLIVASNFKRLKLPRKQGCQFQKTGFQNNR